MTITAPVPGFSLAALARLAAALPLPSAAPSSAQQRSPDVVVFSSAPFRLLSDLASAGLRQLTALLPAIEQALQDDSAAPLGHLAKAAGAAARQITEGHVALLAEGPERVAASLRGEIPIPATATPSEAQQVLRTLARQLGTAAEPEPAPDVRTSETLRTIARQIGTAEPLASPLAADKEASPIERWLGEAKLVLRSTGDALDRAEQQLIALPPATAPDAPSAWALAQITAAQAQVTAAYSSLSHSLREPRRIAAAITAGSFAIPADHLAGATTMCGMLLVLATLWLAGGIWSLVTGTVGLIGIGFWVMRISRASSGVRLDVRR